MPTPEGAKALGAVQTGPALIYHGGPIMPNIQIFNIFWNGAGPALPADYMGIANAFAQDYAGHTISAINTQYSQTGPVNWVHGLALSGGGSFGGSTIVTTPYPSTCTDGVTGTNCFSDSDLRTLIANTMTSKGWTGGLNKMYLVYTGQGEGSCFTGGTSCAYTQYCAYHSYFNVGGTPVVYGNEPYGDTAHCSSPGTGQTFPHANHSADAAVNVASHEVSEAITDPQLNAWFAATGAENGDLCVWTFGVASYAGGTANQQWNGHGYSLQLEYNNHTASCVQVGP